MEKVKINNKYYYLIDTPYGICRLLVSKWNLGRRPSISSALNKTDFFIKKSVKVHGDKYDYSETKYISNSVKIKIICKVHGIFEQTPHSHLEGKGCILCGYLTGSELSRKSLNNFKEEANKVHKNIYNYDLVNYINARTKVKILCKVHGVYEQVPSQHLLGKGCKSCQIGGWSYTDWEVSAKKSKSFDSYKVYFVFCFNSEEEFIKIGRTFRTTSERFSSNFPYEYKILKEVVFSSSEECCKFEKQLQNRFHKFKYKPKLSFNGEFECFLTGIKDELLEKM